MERLIHQIPVRGLALDEYTRCSHYHSLLDIIAIQFKCCGVFYACHACHETLADHPSQRWDADEYDHPAIMCGECGTLISIAAYLGGNSTCPCCRAEFNPGCKAHANLYFNPPE